MAMVGTLALLYIGFNAAAGESLVQMIDVRMHISYALPA